MREALPNTNGLGLLDDCAEADVQVSIDVAGRVSRVRTVNSHEATSAAIAPAITAARNWIFVPAMLDGKTTEADHTIVFRFRSR